MSEQIFIKTAGPVGDPLQRLADGLAASGRCDLGYAEIDAARLGEVLVTLSRDGGSRGRRYHIARAIVQGALDLNGAQIASQVSFEDVEFRGAARGGGDGRIAMSLIDADLGGLGMRACRVGGDLVAEGASIAGDLVLDRVRIAGVVVVEAARIGGGLCLRGCHVRTGSEGERAAPRAAAETAAVLARGLFVGSGVLLDELDAGGRVDFRDARFTQGVSGVRITVAGQDPSEPALDLRHASVGSALDLSQATVRGRLALDQAHVAGALKIDSVMCVDEGAGLDGKGLHLHGGLDAHDATISGPVDLSGLTAGRSVRFVRAAIGEGGNAEGMALNLTAARLGEQLHVTQSKCVGAMLFDEATVARDVSLARTRLFGGEVAVSASHITAGGDVDLAGAFVFGRVCLADAVVGRDLALSGASIKVEAAEAVSAPRVRVARDALFNDGLRSTGGLILEQAQIGGVCDFSGARIASAFVSRNGQSGQSGRKGRHAVTAGAFAPVAGAREAASGSRRASACDPETCAIGLGDATAGVLKFGLREDERACGIVDLTQMAVTRLVDDATAWPPAREARVRDEAGRDVEHWKLDGFTYRKLERPLGAASDAGKGLSVADQRLRWLDGQSAEDLSSNLRVQPFDQLEDVLGAQGFHGAAREVALARARLVAQSSGMSPGRRFGVVAWDLLTGHGYRPWRTVGWLVLAWAVMALVSVWAASHCAAPGCRDESVFLMVRRDGYDPARLRDVYPAFDPLVYAADTVLPLVSFGAREHWRPNPAFGPISALPDLSAGILQLEGAESPGSGPRMVTAGWLVGLAGQLMGLVGAALGVLAVLGFLGLLRPRRGS